MFHIITIRPMISGAVSKFTCTHNRINSINGTSEPKWRNAWFELIKLKRHRPMLQRQLGGLSKARQQPQPPQFVAATALIPGADAAAGCRWRHSTSSLVSKAPAIVVHFLFFPPSDTTNIWAERCCQLRGFGVLTFVILYLN